MFESIESNECGWVSYSAEMKKWAEQFSDFIVYKTRSGDPVNQLYKILDISRPSHLRFMEDDSLVPGYIKNQVLLFNSLNGYEKVKRAASALLPEDIPMSKTKDILANAFSKMIGFDILDESRYSKVSFGFDFNRAKDKLKRVYALDQSGMSFAVMIKKFTDEFVHRSEYTFNQVASRDEKLEAILADHAKIKSLCDTRDLKESISNFHQNCIDVINFYLPDYDISKMKDISSSGIDLYLRAKDDFKAFEKFVVSTGSYDSCMEYKLRDQIYVFESIEDMVNKSVKLPNGFALSLIKSPKRYVDSYFCLVMKQDDVVNVISDYVRYDNPFEVDSMAQRNQRYNAERIENSLFPYEMMNIAFTDNNRVAVETKSDIVVYEDELKVLGHISSMLPDSILWFNFLIQEAKRFYEGEEGKGMPLLAYYGSDSLEHYLIDKKTNTKNLPATYSHSFKIDVKSSQEISKELVDPENDVPFINQWMEDMFSGEITNDLLYIPPEGMVDGKNSALLLDNSGEKKLSVVTISDDESYFKRDEIKKQNTGLKALDSSFIGSEEQFGDYCNIIARYNKAFMIGKLVNKHYQENKSDIEKWIMKKVVKNLPNIIDDLVAFNDQKFFIWQYAETMKKEQVKPINVDLARQVMFASLPYEKRTVRVIDGLIDERSELCKQLKLLGKRDFTAKCYLTKEEDAEYRIFLKVSNIFDLMNITGLERDKFPVFLRHWGLKASRQYGENRTGKDPLAGVYNPWNDMEIFFSLPVSRSGLLEKRKSLGIKGRFAFPTNYFESCKARDDFEKKYENTPEYKSFKSTGIPSARLHYNNATTESFRFHLR